jgi:DNA-binding XRE family transcriptional regulator
MCLYHKMTGNELKRYRATLRMTQADLAHEIAVHPMTVSKWERDSIKIPAPVAKLIEMLVAQAQPPKRRKWMARWRYSKRKRAGREVYWTRYRDAFGKPIYLQAYSEEELVHLLLEQGNATAFIWEPARAIHAISIETAGSQPASTRVESISLSSSLVEICARVPEVFTRTPLETGNVRWAVGSATAMILPPIRAKTARARWVVIDGDSFQRAATRCS